MKKILLLIILLSGSFIFAQNDVSFQWNETKKNPNVGKHLFIQYKLHVGSHLYTGQNLSDFLEDGFVANELRFGWQTTGDAVWERALNYPIYGVGIYNGNIGNPQVLGNPSGLYGFFHFPFWRRLKHHVDMELAFGLTYDLQAYNESSNPENDAIGSEVAVYFNYNFGGNWYLSDAWDFTYGLDFTHFSNGRTTTPNFGLNMVGLNAGMRYHFNPIAPGVRVIDPDFDTPRRPTFNQQPNIRPQRTSEIIVYGALGTTMYELPDAEGGPRGPRFMAWSTYVQWVKRLHNVTAIAVGVDWFYDGSHFENYKRDKNEDGSLKNPDPSQATNLDLMLGGVHVAHSLFLNRINFDTGLGVYFYNPHNYKGKIYFRVAIRYNISDRFFSQIGLKTQNGFAADWVEWGFGYKLFTNKNKN